MLSWTFVAPASGAAGHHRQRQVSTTKEQTTKEECEKGSNGNTEDKVRLRQNINIIALLVHVVKILKKIQIFPTISSYKPGADSIYFILRHSRSHIPAHPALIAEDAYGTQ